MSRLRKDVLKRFLLYVIIFCFIMAVPSHAKKEKPLVMILTTGGTIASVKGEMGLRPAYKPDELLELIPQPRKYARLEGKLLLNLDSTNMQPADWVKIAEEVKKPMTINPSAALL